jgi:hypothetical protein
MNTYQTAKAYMTASDAAADAAEIASGAAPDPGTAYTCERCSTDTAFSACPAMTPSQLVRSWANGCPSCARAAPKLPELTLAAFITPHADFGCDGCGLAVAAGATMFGDRAADYDLCAPCHAAYCQRTANQPDISLSGSSSDDVGSDVEQGSPRTHSPHAANSRPSKRRKDY